MACRSRARPARTSPPWGTAPPPARCAPRRRRRRTASCPLLSPRSSPGEGGATLRGRPLRGPRGEGRRTRNALVLLLVSLIPPSSEATPLSPLHERRHHL